MRHHSQIRNHPGVPTPAKGEVHSVLPGRDWETLKRLFPYLWEYKWRVLAALLFMIGAKVANVGVPMLLKKLVDTLNTVSSTSNVTQLASTAPLNNDPNKTHTVFGFIGDTLQSGLHDAFVLVPAALLIAYALLRLSVSAFTELRELVFAKATQGAARRIALETCLLYTSPSPRD